MLAAVDAPKSKSITVAWMALKASVLGYVLSGNFLAAGRQCGGSVKSLTSILEVFYLLAIILDAVSLFYFYCSRPFSRLQYYVFYGFHILLTLFSTVTIVSQLNHLQQCPQSEQFFGAVFLLNFIFILSAVVVMWINVYSGLKFAHLGSNILWVFMWVAIQGCSGFIASMIGILHLAFSVAGFLLFVLLKFLKKTSLATKVWKGVFLASILAMASCYLLALIATLFPSSCSNYFLTSYRIFGVLELVSPLLALLFLRFEIGDPREKIIQPKAHLHFNEEVNLIISDLS